MTNTQDLSKFGYVELKETIKLLTAYLDAPDDIFWDEVKVEFNPESGSVFLIDKDYNVAMMNGDKLEKWVCCPSCNTEGFVEDIWHDGDVECMEWLIDIGAKPPQVKIVDNDDQILSDILDIWKVPTEHRARMLTKLSKLANKPGYRATLQYDYGELDYNPDKQKLLYFEITDADGDLKLHGGIVFQHDEMSFHT